MSLLPNPIPSPSQPKTTDQLLDNLVAEINAGRTKLGALSYATYIGLHRLLFDNPHGLTTEQIRERLGEPAWAQLTGEMARIKANINAASPGRIDDGIAALVFVPKPE